MWIVILFEHKDLTLRRKAIYFDFDLIKYDSVYLQLQYHVEYIVIYDISLNIIMCFILR